MKFPRIPNNVDVSIRTWMTSLNTLLNNEFNRKQDRDAIHGSVKLASPDGSVYTVQVLDDGTLTTTKVG